MPTEGNLLKVRLLNHMGIKQAYPLELLFALSPSTAERERAFPAIKAVKTRGRSTISKLNQIRIVTCGPSVKDFDPSDSVDHWLNSCSGSDSRHFKPITKPSTAADIQPGPSTTMSASAIATTATPDDSSTDLFSEVMTKLGDSATRHKLQRPCVMTSVHSRNWIMDSFLLQVSGMSFSF